MRKYGSLIYQLGTAETMKTRTTNSESWSQGEQCWLAGCRCVSRVNRGGAAELAGPCHLVVPVTFQEEEGWW